MKKNTYRFLGLIQVIPSIFWIQHIISLYYYYNYTDILFAFMYPQWVLFLNIILCLLNIYFGIKLIRDKISIKKSYSIMGVLLTTGIIVNNFYYLI